MPFFSIIIPVYNVEEYLRDCVESVLIQTFENYEVILVDDGSKDCSGNICDEFADKNERVSVIHKSNGGLSEARNFGIKEAQGQYLMFLDSDDYWDDADALRKIYNALREAKEEADIVLFQAKLLYPDGTIIPDKGEFAQNFNEMKPIESLQYLSEKGLLIGSACSKVVRRKFLFEHDLFFKVGIKREDIEWILRVANFLPKYIYTNQFFYIYRKGRPGSITSSVSYASLMEFVNILESFMNFSYCNETVKACLLGYVAYEYCILLAQFNFLEIKAEKQQIKRKLKDMKCVLAYDIHPKVKLIHTILRVLGFDITTFILGAYLRYRKR